MRFCCCCYYHKIRDVLTIHTSPTRSALHCIEIYSTASLRMCHIICTTVVALLLAVFCSLLPELFSGGGKQLKSSFLFDIYDMRFFIQPHDRKQPHKFKGKYIQFIEFRVCSTMICRSKHCDKSSLIF